jgi:very-short-patch-repair endonuclease
MPEPLTAVEKKLLNWQAQLLDLSRANRLLYFKAERSGAVPIVQPPAEELFQQLVVRGKTFSFPASDQLPSLEVDQSTDAPVNPIPDQSTNQSASPLTDQPPTSHRRATELITALPDQRLPRALYNLRARARAALEEQGLNVLFVAFGQLAWIDPVTRETAHSPLVLVPVTLSLPGLGKPYTLSMLEDDVVLNPTLLYKFQTDFKLELPELPDFETNGLPAYLDRIRAAIGDRSGWAVTLDTFLGVFSFQKISLYQDLVLNKARYLAHPVIAALGGAGPLPPPPELIPAAELDDRIPPAQVFQVLDADSSQQEAIQAARQGASFVLQGPPGTGKSQTIANIIAEFLAAGRSVLFVSQKMAALEVVQRRLNETGLGEFCLQLHSHRRDKREVVAELVETLNAAGWQLRPDYEADLLEVGRVRDRLNAYTRALHAPRFALRRSVFDAHGELARLHGAPELSFAVGEVTTVDAGELARRIDLLERLAALPDVIDQYAQHPWRGAVTRSVSFALRDQLTRALDALLKLAPACAARLDRLAAACGLRAPRTVLEARPLIDFLREHDVRIFTLDLAAMRERFATRYQSFLRSVMSDYRADLQALTNVRFAKDKLTYETAIATLERALALRSALSPNDAPRAGAASVNEAAEAAALLQQIDQLSTPLIEVYGLNPIEHEPFEALPAWLSARRPAMAQLDDMAAFNRLRDEAPALQLAAGVDAALRAGLPAAQWRAAYLLAFWRAFVDAATAADEALRAFDSRAHAALIDRFRTLDRQQLTIAQARIRALAGERRPRSSWIDAASAEQAILRREAAKKRRLKSLRKLFAEIPRLITELKPCLLMSPVTVSMLLDPAVYTFDLVIFDEASQIAPEEAAGAIMRGRQTIIVGDKLQLPPTRFFEVVGTELDDEADNEETGRTFDSILEECEGLNLPQKLLRWHYRSRDESLIAFSNRHFYHDRLYTFPNVRYAGDQLGIEFVFVPDGVYLRGRNLRRNEVEARRVVDLIFAHAASTPQRSLGVIAFSYAQRDAIRIEWERRRREQPEFEAFFDEDAPEPFFIKNLEMVQGDERDAIIFSVGYGKDESGKLIYNFGPLNQAGGERRLNVAVSRARYQVKLVASIQPEDIDLTRTTSQGARLLKDYMLLARDGLHALSAPDAPEPALTGATAEAAFEQAVAQAFTARGLQLHRQVGTSAYKIDLAVIDPDQPGRYRLGIETDGPAYASAQTARDRDRLRRQVLESLGWQLVRVWSRDWVADPDRETAKIMEILDPSEDAPAPMPIDPPAPAAAAAHYLAAAQHVAAPQALPTFVWPYKRARLTPHGSGEELGQADPALVAGEVARVVKLEGPVHVDEVADRITAAWGVTRAGRRIQAVLTRAVEVAVLTGAVIKREDFLWPIGLEKPIVRVPDTDEQPRPIEHIAPEEIAEATYLCVAEARRLQADDVIRETAQLLGYSRAAPRIEALVNLALSQLQAAGRIEMSENVVRTVEPLYSR